MQFTGTEWWIGWTFHSVAAVLAPLLAAVGSATHPAAGAHRERRRTRCIRVALVVVVLLSMAHHDGIPRLGVSLLGFAVGSAILCLHGRWTERVAPAAAACMAYVEGLPPEVAACGALVGFGMAMAVCRLIQHGNEEFCNILQGMCGAALFCLSAAELLIP